MKQNLSRYKLKSVQFIPRKTKLKGKPWVTALICFEVTLEYNQKRHCLSFEIDSGSNGTVIFPYALTLAKSDLAFPQEEKSEEILMHKFGTIPIEKKMRVRIDHDTKSAQTYDSPINCGIIGTDFFKNYVLNINYAQKIKYYLCVLKPNQCKFVLHNNLVKLDN